MPTSPFSNISKIVEIVANFQPKPTRILDVGIGFGKYGLLCREYLTFVDSQSSQRFVIVDGIEAFEGYVGEIQKSIYDDIFLGEAAHILGKMRENEYDLVLLIDVLEHFDREKGIDVISDCIRIGRSLIVSTPRVFWPQGNGWGNPYERHLSIWSRKDLYSMGATAVFKCENWIAVFLRDPVVDNFSFRYRCWRYAEKLLPAFLRPTIKNVLRK